MLLCEANEASDSSPSVPLLLGLYGLPLEEGDSLLSSGKADRSSTSKITATWNGRVEVLKEMLLHSDDVQVLLFRESFSVTVESTILVDRETFLHSNGCRDTS